MLHSFSGGADGANPYAGLTRDSLGNLYGATDFGGSDKIAAGAHVETVLYSFLGMPDGAYPNTRLSLDEQGDLYGTTLYGGTAFSGTIFKIIQANAP